MAETTQETAQTFEFQAEMKQLLHLIIHSLYTHQEIFLRELISNASDALNKMRFRQLTENDLGQSALPLTIEITVDPESRTLTITDTGIGMTHEDLVQRIGTIASSGTLAFLEQLKKADKPVDAHLIGQFGVGFYSAFMVADEIEIETRHADRDAQGYRWRSSGEGQFSIEPIPLENRGTRIVLHLKEEASEYVEEYRIRQIIRKYSSFVEFPILLADEQVNTIKALWQQNKDEVTEEEREEFYKFLTHDAAAPLGHLHLQIEGLKANFNALLFVPATAPMDLFRQENQHALHLYASNIFIQDDCEALLPEYLRFVKGVVDTEDLPLNVSREVTQSSPVMTRMRGVLTKKMLGMLEEWTEEEAGKYTTFYQQFGPLFKTGLASDYEHRDQIMELLRFESTHTEAGTLTSLKDYVSRMPASQADLYYLLGPNREVALRNPNLEYFQKHHLEVLLLTDPVDAFILPYLFSYEGKSFKSIEKADLDLASDEDAEQEALPEDAEGALLNLFKTTLGDRVKEVVASKRLVQSAATLVVDKEGMDTQMEHLMKMMNQPYTPQAKTLEVNTAHPLLKNMARMQAEGSHQALLEQIVQQLHEGALLIEGNLEQPTSFVERMTAVMVAATEEQSKPVRKKKG